MKYEDFITLIQTKIQERMGEKAQVWTRQILKNNGLRFMALLIQEAGSKVVPVIYLDGYFKDYQNGVDIPKLVDQMVESYEKSRITDPISISPFVDFEKVRGRLACKLINRERNRELLEEIPYQEFLDLAVVVYYWLEDGQLGEGMILVYHSHLQIWGITKEELFEVAMENTRRIHPMALHSVKSILEYHFGGVIKSEEYASAMYVLTNRSEWLGAACILYDDMLQEISQELQDDFWILPSSIHESIIVPRRFPADKEDLQKMLREINQEKVAEENFLSDQVYLYTRDVHRLSM